MTAGQRKDMELSVERSLALFIVLSRAYNWANKHSERDIRRHGINATEFAVLELLYHKGPQPLQHIGDKILISSGNITYVVDKLERKQFLIRRPSREDRRMIYAELTDAGRDFIASVFPAHAEAIRQALAGLDEQEKETIIPLLKKLGIAAQQAYS